MMFIFSSLLIILHWISLTKCQTLTANIYALETFDNPSFVGINCWPERLRHSSGFKIYSTVPVWSCNITFHETLSCDAMLNWNMSAIDNNERETLIFEDNDTISHCQEKSRRSYISTMMDSLQVCLKTSRLCPLQGDFFVDQCRLRVGKKAVEISKKWKAHLTFSQNGKQIFGFMMKLEMDETEVLKYIRPSAGQKIPRRRFKK